MESKRNFLFKFLYSCLGLIFLLLNQTAYAVVIGHDTVITGNTTYSNTTVDLSDGNFIIRTGGTLTIENCNIIGTLSTVTPSLFSVEWGHLNLRNNQVKLTTALVHPTPRSEAAYYAIRLGRTLSANITGNTFTIDKQFSAGLLNSSLILPNKEVVIAYNTLENFHGGIYLLNAINSLIDHNVFRFNSSGNIVFVGNNSQISNNAIYFSGLNQFGDAITLVDSESVNVNNNVIFTPTSESISVTLSRNIVIDSNTLTGGITYGIHLFSNSELVSLQNNAARLLSKMDKRNFRHVGTSDITISNNFMGQNRYGIAAEDVTNLTVTGNYFSQRFPDAATRKFWTDNNVLFKNVYPLTWKNNIYKEAFTQINKGDNSMTQFVEFPQTGGVVL